MRVAELNALRLKVLPFLLVHGFNFQQGGRLRVLYQPIGVADNVPAHLFELPLVATHWVFRQYIDSCLLQIFHDVPFDSVSVSEDALCLGGDGCFWIGAKPESDSRFTGATDCRRPDVRTALLFFLGFFESLIYLFAYLHKKMGRFSAPN